MVSKTTIAIPLAVGAGVSLYAYLTYLRRKKNRDDEMPMQEWTKHRMVINKAYAYHVLGQLEFIKIRSNTLINVLNLPDEDLTFSIVIRGTPECVQEAEAMVNRLIESSPEMISSLIEVPKEKIKLLVGDFGNGLSRISEQTGSKLLLRCDPDFYEASVLNDPAVISKLSNEYLAVSPFFIEIQGSREKNALAYELIRQALSKEIFATPAPTTYRWAHLPKESPKDVINASQDSKYVEVTVSSITSINRFYVQIFRLRSSLEDMERRIADCVVSPSNTFIQPEKPFRKGDMIAVPYEKQGKWHRAKISAITKKNVASSTVHVRFVDYGDEEEVKVDKIRRLPEEFLRYPKFAVKCSVAGVRPETLYRAGEDGWRDEALDLFEQLVSGVTSKILMARKVGDYEGVYWTAKRINGWVRRYKIPALDLVDTNSAEDIDIAQELISKGYARSTVGADEASRPDLGPRDSDDSGGFEMP